MARQKYRIDPFDWRSGSIACYGVCAMGPATMNDVFTLISTQMRRPRAFQICIGEGIVFRTVAQLRLLRILSFPRLPQA
jgi:hypothetical protein